MILSRSSLRDLRTNPMSLLHLSEPKLYSPGGAEDHDPGQLTGDVVTPWGPGLSPRQSLPLFCLSIGKWVDPTSDFITYWFKKHAWRYYPFQSYMRQFVTDLSAKLYCVCYVFDFVETGVPKCLSTAWLSVLVNPTSRAFTRPVFLSAAAQTCRMLQPMGACVSIHIHMGACTFYMLYPCLRV